MKVKTLSIIGAGKVGSVLARFFKQKGWYIERIIDRSEEAAKALGAQVQSSRYSERIDSIRGDENIIMISVPDDVIAGVVSEIVMHARVSNSTAIFHTSGLHSSDTLLPLKEAGCTTFSLHPIQTFFSREMDERLCEGIGAGIEGDESGVAAGFELVHQLGWKPLRVTKEMKPMYHAACVFAANYLTTLAEISADLLSRSSRLEGRAIDYILPMMNAALEAIKTASPRDVLTGPVARAQVETIQDHLNILSFHAPDDYELYIELALQSARIAFEGKKISSKQYAEMTTSLSLLRKHA